MESSSKSLTRQQKQALWQSRVEAWQTSQLPQEQFCEKEGLNRHTFKYWRQKFNHRKPEVNGVPVSLVSESSSPPSFSASSFRSSGLRVLVNERLQQVCLIHIFSDSSDRGATRIPMVTRWLGITSRKGPV